MAFCIHILNLEEKLKKKQKEIMVIKTGTDADTMQNLVTLKRVVEELTKQIEANKHWVIRLYNRGASKWASNLSGKSYKKYRNN